MFLSLPIRCFAVLILPVATSCALGVVKRQDRMCAEVAAFAAATFPGQRHSVVLRGGWGGDTPNTLLTHDCKHMGYSPGKVLCEYLVPNTSWEFGNYNAKRVAECLDSPGRHEFVRRVDSYEWPAEMTSSLQLLKDKTIQITVRLESGAREPGSLADLSVLTLSAMRKAAEL